MEFHYTNPQTELERLFGGFHCINAIGTIEPGDDEKFGSFLCTSAPPPRLCVYIDSPGGDVDAAIGIGLQIRQNWFSTAVGSYVLDLEKNSSPIHSRTFIPGRCMSAATLVYLGGRLRYFADGAVFGVHQFSFQNPSPEDIGRSQVLSAKIASYVSDMGVSSKFLEVSSSTASSEINSLSEADLVDLGVVTGGQTDANWSVQARNQMIYVRGERDSLFGFHKVMLGYVKGTGFLFWAVIEAQGRENELTNYALVEIVLNGEEIRLDISSRCLRFPLDACVNVIARISDAEAKMIAHSESFGVQIRTSSEAPVFLGIAAMGTDGGAEQLQTFFSTLCGSDGAE